MTEERIPKFLSTGTLKEVAISEWHGRGTAGLNGLVEWRIDTVCTSTMLQLHSHGTIVDYVKMANRIRMLIYFQYLVTALRLVTTSNLLEVSNHKEELENNATNPGVSPQTIDMP